MRRLIVWAGLVVTMLARGAAPAHMPTDWYRLPEDGIAPKGASWSFTPLAWTRLNRSIENILQANANALRRLDEIDGYSGRQPSHWRVSALEFNFGITVSGLFAPLTLTANTQLNVVFQRPLVTSPPRGGPRETRDVVRFGGAEANDARAQLEPWIRKAMASGRVFDENALRKNLYARADTFQKLAGALDQSLGTRWFASRFRLDLWVSASGTVGVVASAGATLRLRFEWELLAHRGGLPAKIPHPVAPTPLQRHFRRFLHALARDLDSQDYQEMTKLKFFPNSVFLALGMTASGTIGIATAGGGIAGYVYFTFDPSLPPPVHGPEDKRITPTEPLYLIESRPSKRHLHYARANAITYETESLVPGILENAIYKLSHRAFRRGLKRAARMSTWYAERADRIQTGDWQITDLMPYFQLGMGGSLSLLTLSGYGAVGFDFYNGRACRKGEKPGCEG